MRPTSTVSPQGVLPNQYQKAIAKAQRRTHSVAEDSASIWVCHRYNYHAQRPQRLEAPADVIANAVHVMRIVTGEIDVRPVPLETDKLR
jgi:hypothetical protein